MATFIDPQTLDHGLQTLLHLHPQPNPLPHLKHIQQLYNQTDDTDPPLDGALVTACVRKLGADPLNLQGSNPYYPIFSDNFDFPLSPAATYHINLNNLKHVQTDMKLTPPTPEELGVYKSWTLDALLYSPKHIYDLLSVSYSYTTFKKTHNLPDLLTYKQTVYLLLVIAQSEHYSLRKGCKDFIRHRLGENAKHLFPLGKHETVWRTKVGKVYGTWKFLECMSPTENTSKNASVNYRALCRVCNREEIVDYRNTNRKCKNCNNIQKEAYYDKDTLPEPIRIYLLRDNQILLGNERPADAIAVAKFVHKNQLTGWEFYEGRPKRAAQADVANDEAIRQELAQDAPKRIARPILGDLSINPLNVLPDSELHGF